MANPGLCDQVHASLHREILQLVGRYGTTDGVLLDIGCWNGQRTLAYARAMQAQTAIGVEVSPEQAATAAQVMTCHMLDIETDPLPISDAGVDAIVCNQLMEHCKNIFLPLDEMWRVLRPGGTLIFSVPNLASLHNRVLLATGRQPTSIRPIGPHVRGFSHRSTCALLQLNGRFIVEDVVGVGFPPLPSRIGDRIAALLPGMSHTTVIAARRSGAGTSIGWREAVAASSGQTTWGGAAVT
ncbi:MAG: class I SAM-dependent methyltransferase [Thermoleophilia bacterium]